MSIFKKALAAIAGLFMIIGLAGCAAEAVDMSKVTSVIDVRTAAEFQAGHLEGAINIDVESGMFEQEITQLDKVGTYVIYCHTGRRAGIAKDTMTGLGFTNVSNAGGLSDAAATTGLAIVQ